MITPAEVDTDEDSILEPSELEALTKGQLRTLAAQLEVTVPSAATKSELVTAIYESQFEAVTPEGTENPSEEGWYEKGDDDLFVLSEDTEVDSETTYYSFTSPIDLTGI